MESKQQDKKETKLKATKEWIEQNRARYNAYQRNYRKEHYDQIREREKRLYEAKREPYTCECGAQIIKPSIMAHLKTKKHKRFLAGERVGQ